MQLAPNFTDCESRPSSTHRLDASIEVAKDLSKRELLHGMESEDFFAWYMQGDMPGDAAFVEWANDYRHYLALRRGLTIP